MSACAFVALATAPARARGDDAKAEPPAPEAVVRRVADFFKATRSAAVEVERAQTAGELAIKQTLSLAFQRPNRLAIRSAGGPAGIIVVCDGKTLSVAVPALRKYTEAAAPASFDDLAREPLILGSVQGTLFDALAADDPYAKIMAGVKSASYAGLVTLDGAKAHHLRFTQDQFDWELWVAADGDPVLRRTVLDLSKALAKMPGAEVLKGRKLELVHTFKGWRIDQDLDEKTFKFDPPEGVQKVDSFFQGLGSARESRPSLVGQPAPDVNLKRLDQGEFRLKDHRGAHVVMLDFWASWCGPCVQELPILIEVARDYEDKGVVFCGVNLRETPEQIRQFLAKQKLEFTVALDAEGAVGTSYQAEAIPMLVLIDKKGVVQAVHVGYNPAIKATLRKELDALLEGKDLAAESLRAAREAEKAEGLERAWAVAGPYDGVATAAGGRVLFAVQRTGRCDVLDPDGKTTRTFRLPSGNAAIVRHARRAGGTGALLAFRTWGPSVLAAQDDDGTRLWEEASGQGVDDVWAADLDGDGVDEVIIGYNGATGLHVFSADGKRLWKRTDLGNVWHVTAGDLDGDGHVEVVTTSAQGKVHLSAAADGRPLRTLDPGLYANMVRVAPGRTIPDARGDVALVVGSGASETATMAALGGDGKTYWTLDFPAGAAHCDSLAVSPDGSWAAVGLRGGRVCVVEVGRGRIVAQVGGQGATPMVAWARPDGDAPPLLIVANGREVGTFRVKPAAASPEGDRP